MSYGNTPAYGKAGCLTAFVSSFSRILLLMAWIARPAMMNAAFSTFIIPCLGILFLPFTTLMYVFLIQGVGGIQGIGWFWLFLAVVMDIASIGAAGATNRDRIPPGYPGSYRSYQEKELYDPVTGKPVVVTEPGPAPVPAAAPAAPDTPSESKPESK
jgi:hypothetical protein